MRGSLALVLHAHLPFVRHPEHTKSLEERWLFEAITESYIPLLQTLQGWEKDRLPGSITFSVTPTLCAMLRDPLLQARYRNYLNQFIRLADSEIHRTHWEKPLQKLAIFYFERLQSISQWHESRGGDIVGAFRDLQASGRIEIMACCATHAVLPLLSAHPTSLRAQVMVGRDEYLECFGVQPRGFWLPECAWCECIDTVLAEAGVQWFITETSGVLNGVPRPRYGPFAPVITPAGIAAFGRDNVSARQVWSREEGYPGDPWYRDFYRDIGFDLDLDYVQEFLPAKERRSFTGIKYHRITGGGQPKLVYDRAQAMQRASEHARHFLEGRFTQIDRLRNLFHHPVVVCPYDAELFGHWWYEGPEFIDTFVRRAVAEQQFDLTTPGKYLQSWPTHQVSTPADSSWGEQGFWKVWLNEKNHWITGRIAAAQERMSKLTARAGSMDSKAHEALRQAGRELLLAQSSDWPFIIRTGTSPEYASRRVKTHLLRFWRICDQIESGQIDSDWLVKVEATDNLFPNLNCDYWK